MDINVLDRDSPLKQVDDEYADNDFDDTVKIKEHTPRKNLHKKSTKLEETILQEDLAEAIEYQR